MTKDQLSHILDRIDYWRERDDRIQKLYNDFNETFAESSYPPIIEHRATTAFIDALTVTNPKLKESLEYYAYELPNMDKVEGEMNGKTYNLKDRSEFVDFTLYELSIIS